MPIQNCQVDRKPGYRYGQSGKCYIYKEGDKASQTRARNKARKQGIAQIINGFEFSLMLLQIMEQEVVLSYILVRELSLLI